jgi:hypothetical protein
MIAHRISFLLLFPFSAIGRDQNWKLRIVLFLICTNDVSSKNCFQLIFYIQGLVFGFCQYLEIKIIYVVTNNIYEEHRIYQYRGC